MTDIIKQVKYIQKDFEKTYAEELKKHNDIPDILKNIIHKELPLIRDIVNISEHPDIKTVCTDVYNIRNCVVADLSHEIIIKQYGEFKYKRFFQLLLNGIDEHELVKYLSISNKIKKLNDKGSVFEKITFVKKKCKSIVEKKNKKFIKKYPKLFNMIYEGINMKLLEQLVDNINKYEKGEINDKQSAYTAAKLFAQNYYPHYVLKDEGLL